MKRLTSPAPNGRHSGWRLATCIVLLLAAGLTARPADAVVRYVAFGDSITRGNACDEVGAGGGVPSDSFDNGSGCKPTTACGSHTQDNADNCGFTWRLEADLINVRNIDAEVENAGDAGELIVQGVVRLDSRISAGDAVLILMEGTNDLSKLIRGDVDSISTTAMKNTLGVMTDKATDLGMDTLLISPIRRVCPGYPGTCPTTGSGGPIAHPDEPNTTSLASKISDLHNELNRERLSGWQKFGKTQDDVDDDYYQSDPRIGHIDASGYVKMANEIEGKIFPDDDLDAPTPVSPIGDTDDSGVFAWDDIPATEDQGATLYQLQIDGPLGGSFHNEFYERADICTNGDCSIDIGSVGAGSYTWKARGTNLRGRGAYSSPTAFSVITAPPGTPTLVSPPPDPTGDPPLAVAFTWNALSQASEYRLQVDDTGGTVIDETFLSTAVCAGGTCSATPSTLLDTEDYSWRLLGTNAIGDGPWSAPNIFSIVPDAPAATKLTYPLSNVYQQDPITFRWKLVDTADEYDLDIDGGVTVFQGASCGTTICESPQEGAAGSRCPFLARSHSQRRGPRALDQQRELRRAPVHRQRHPRAGRRRHRHRHSLRDLQQDHRRQRIHRADRRGRDLPQRRRDRAPQRLLGGRRRRLHRQQRPLGRRPPLNSRRPAGLRFVRASRLT